jgi:hypothetical protein
MRNASAAHAARSRSLEDIVAKLKADEASFEEEDPEIGQKPSFEEKYGVAWNLFLGKIFKPVIQGLLFEHGRRFPQLEILVALEYIFSSDLWPERLSDFNVCPLMNKHIEIVINHFSSDRTNFASLVSSIGLNFDVDDSVFIDAQALRDSVPSLRVHLWQARIALKDRKAKNDRIAAQAASGQASSSSRSSSSSGGAGSASLGAVPVPGSGAGASASAPTNTGWTNPVLKMIGTLTAALTGSELVPPPKPPQLSVRMHELIEEFMNLHSVEQMCPAWCLLAMTALVVAVGTTSPERTFSAVSLIKTPLRNRMGPPMLDALLRIKLLTSCGLEQTETSINLLKECAWTWVSAQSRRAEFGDPPTEHAAENDPEPDSD